jgi:hypothetical protein
MAAAMVSKIWSRDQPPSSRDNRQVAELADEQQRGVVPSDPEFWRAAGGVEARKRLSDALRFELLGPEAPEEELVESPITRYLTGMLAPFGTEVASTEQDESLALGEGDEDAGAADAAPPLSQAMSPSSIGLSFLLIEGTLGLTVTATWGDYERLAALDEASDEEEEGESPEEAEPEEEGSPDEPAPRRRRPPRWRRVPRAASLNVTLRPGDGLQGDHRLPDDGVTIEHLTRRVGDQLAVSVFLVNRRPDDAKGHSPADRWIFQPELCIRGTDGEAVFLPRSLERRRTGTDRDADSNRLLYRAKLEFAVGHGCAADWNRSDDSRRAVEVRTNLIPGFELARVEPRVIGGSGLDMAVLAKCGSPTELNRLLRPVLESYSAWIEGEQTPRLETLTDDLRSVAADHIDACRDSLRRMEEALVLLVDHPEAFEAFRFANHAMLLQRSHTDWAAKRRKDRGSAPAEPNIEGRWRPFQLAFILLNLPALIEPSHTDRRTGDLLWFPTGGGKTEAYLGLAAFALALRRLRTVPGLRTDAGVSVLMRYTLRLLTIQQFQRAVAMICACDVLRRRDPAKWGERSFSIGLWVGMRATPNRHAEARLGLTRLKAGERQVDKNPCQLESCPWCGTSLGYADYWDDGDAVRIRVACPEKDCEFSRQRSHGLPVVLVDEEIYRECPAMVISTVDKFAQMPWNGEIQALFGRIDRECSRCGFLTADSNHKGHGRSGSKETLSASAPLAPPDLIIQDELHLISGPLGTLVGLYETAVDVLCARTDAGAVIKPKLVASTATVRRAYEQVRAIFDRSLKVFPPPGLEPSDSFFAVESPLTQTSPGRLYMGVMAPGKSMKTAVVRVSAALLASSAGLALGDARLADAYKTLVLYFNSLRELGGAVRLMDDDVPARLGQLEERGFPRRFAPVYAELTSRVFSEQIPALLRQLEQPHDVPRDEGDPFPLDAVLASNMISVGVDVSRLGLMVVNGQPKMSSEYIQATGRVGRETWAPGLVVTIYNWTRPRDLSHYERFSHYHETFYRNVEAVSATPFSSRARDRGLAGAFVSATRLGSSTLSPETAANRFDADDPEVGAVIEQFRSRAEATSDAQTASQLEAQLIALSEEWSDWAAEPLRYGWRSPDPAKQPGSEVLLRAAEGGRWGHWDAPGSLREVEQQSRVYLLDVDGS